MIAYWEWSAWAAACCCCCCCIWFIWPPMLRLFVPVPWPLWGGIWDAIWWFGFIMLALGLGFIACLWVNPRYDGSKKWRLYGLKNRNKKDLSKVRSPLCSTLTLQQLEQKRSRTHHPSCWGQPMEQRLCRPVHRPGQQCSLQLWLKRPQDWQLPWQPWCLNPHIRVQLWRPNRPRLLFHAQSSRWHHQQLDHPIALQKQRFVRCRRLPFWQLQGRRVLLVRTHSAECVFKRDQLRLWCELKTLWNS